MLKVAVGHSEDVLAAEAVREVLSEIEQTLEGREPQAGILFCSLELDHRYILSEIRRVYPSIELIGCTTDGEMSSVCGFTEDSIVLMAFASDNIEIRAGAGRNIGVRGMEAGREAVTTACEGLSRRGQERFGVMLIDPLNAGVSDVDKGMSKVMGENFPFFGAATAAHSKKKTTYQFYNDEVNTDSVAVLLFSGPVLFSFGMQGGHAPIGGKEVITSCEKNVLYRIGDEPALNYFRRYVGDKYDLFMNYCLAIFEEGRKGFYVRSAPFYDVEAGSVTLNGAVPEGALIQIGTADKKICVESCAESLKTALDGYPGSKPAAALHFSCAGRKMMMGTQVVREYKTVKNHLIDIPFCGYYAYGEICPMQPGDKPLFHGTTFVTLLIGAEE